MMERIRDGLWYLRLSIASMLRRQPRLRSRRYSPPVKGNMRSVIVVKPDNAMFAEACFVLSDKYVRESGQSNEELLRQARDAANAFAGAAVPPGNVIYVRAAGYVLSFLAGTAAGVLLRCIL